MLSVHFNHFEVLCLNLDGYLFFSYEIAFFLLANCEQAVVVGVGLVAPSLIGETMILVVDGVVVVTVEAGVPGIMEVTPVHGVRMRMMESKIVGLRLLEAGGACP